METTSVFNTLETSLLGGFNPNWWWGIYGLAVFVSVIFFMAVLYHWLRYETNSTYSTAVIFVNGIVTIILLGSAAVLLTTYLAKL